MIALQHMVPPLMVVYIEQFCDVLEFGGYGYFQVPTKLVADYSQFKCSVITCIVASVEFVGRFLPRTSQVFLAISRSPQRVPRREEAAEEVGQNLAPLQRRASFWSSGGRCSGRRRSSARYGGPGDRILAHPTSEFRVGGSPPRPESCICTR